jgi:peptide/nickel transport system substrate-binding protein
MLKFTNAVLAVLRRVRLAMFFVASLLLMSSFTIFPNLQKANAAAVAYSPACLTTGGNLVTALPVDPAALSNAVTTDVNTAVISPAIMEGLVTLDTNYSPQPLLAKSWTTSPDGLTVTFNLRDNVSWSDGKPFNSSDVAYSIMNVNAKFSGFAVSPLANVANVTTPDAFTAVFHLKNPEPYLVPAMNSWYAPIVPKHIYFGTNTTSILQNPANNAPIGTGPFMYKSWTHGSSIILVRNPNYWKAGLPCLDQVTVNIIPTHASAVVAFQTGQIGYVPWEELDTSAITTVKAVQGATTVGLTDNVGQTSLWLNNRSPLMGKLAVRQAFAYALDGPIKQQVVQLAYSGSAITSDNPFARTEPTWYNPNPNANQSKVYPYNVTKAAALLDQAGYPKQSNGTRFSIRLTYQSTQTAFAQTAQVVKNALGAIGVNAILTPLDVATYSQVQFGNRSLINWEATINQLGLSIDPAIGVTRSYLSTSCVNGVAFACANNYNNSAVDTLLKPALFESNVTKRASIFFQAQTLLVADTPSIWLVHAVNTGVYGNGFVNVLPKTSMSELADYSQTYWTGGVPNPAAQSKTSSASTTSTSTTSTTTPIIQGITTSSLSTTTSLPSSTSSSSATTQAGGPDQTTLIAAAAVIAIVVIASFAYLMRKGRKPPTAST